MFDIWMEQLIEGAGSEENIPNIWTAIVADNTKVNPSAGKRLEEKFPKLFFNGCRTHCADLLVEDIVKLTEIDHLIAGHPFCIPCSVHWFRMLMYGSRNLIPCDSF